MELESADQIKRRAEVKLKASDLEGFIIQVYNRLALTFL